MDLYVIRVDNSTGIVDNGGNPDRWQTNYDEAINKLFHSMVCPPLPRGLFQGIGRRLPITTSASCRIRLNSRNVQAFNEESAIPLNVYGPALRRSKFASKGTSFINPMWLWFVTPRKWSTGLDKPQVTHWAATITFKVHQGPMAEKDRAINPLGFQVTEYRTILTPWHRKPLPRCCPLDALPRLRLVSVFLSADATAPAAAPHWPWLCLR